MKIKYEVKLLNQAVEAYRFRLILYASMLVYQVVFHIPMLWNAAWAN